MTSQLIEANVLAEISAALAELPDKHCLSGIWQTTAPGVVKGEEPEDAVAVVGVATSGFSRETFSLPTGSYTVAVSLAVRNELDPCGEVFLRFAAALESLFQAWQGETYQQHFARLDTPGFSVGDVAVESAPPMRVKSAECCSMTWTVTLRGTQT